MIWPLGLIKPAPPTTDQRANSEQRQCAGRGDRRAKVQVVDKQAACRIEYRNSVKWL